VESDDLFPEQFERLKATVARHLRFYDRLLARMQAMGFPPGDPLVKSATTAANGVHAMSVVTMPGCHVHRTSGLRHFTTAFLSAVSPCLKP